MSVFILHCNINININIIIIIIYWWKHNVTIT